MPDPTTKEKAPENNKAKQTAYLVCEGTLCQCDAGAAPVKLKVDSHKKAYINDNKLLATVKDVKFELPTAPFVTCKNIPSQNKTCQPQFEKWTKPYKDIDVEGNQVITDKSELLCMAYGGKITIKMHGQQQTVNAGQAQNMDRSIAAQVNPLADLAPIPEADKKVSVNSITGKLVDDPKYKTVGSQKTNALKSSKDSDKDKDPADIYVRPGQEVEFTATYAGTESLVCWKLKGTGEPMYFLQHGAKYKTSFPAPGKYTIEGYGTGGDSHLDVDTQINTKKERVKRAEYTECMLDVLVQVNKLTGISHVQSDSILDKYENKKFVEAQIRIGVPATFEPVYLMAPVQAEVDHLILLIRDASGNEIQRCKGKANIIFEARNAAAAYTVEAYFDNSDDAPFTYAFRTMQNTVSIISASALKNENEKIRLGTHVQFTVSKFQFTDDTVASELIESEHAQIKWYENSETPAAVGLTYAKTYQREDDYTVVCKVTEGKPGWFATKKNGQDDFHFNVTKNYPTAIEQKTAGKAKIGKQISFELKGIFAMDHSDLATLNWQLTGPETKSTSWSQTFLFVPAKKGTYALAATMNGKTIKITFESIACEIVKGWWTDSDGNILTGENDDEEPRNTIGFAGWEQEVVASFKHVGLNGEDVTLEVWDNDIASSTSLFIKHMKIPDTGNAFTCAFKLDQKIRDKIKEKGITSDGSLYFTVKAKNGLKVINDGMTLPDGDNYLKVDSTSRIRAYFADNNDTKRYSTAALDTPVHVQIKSTNLIGEELELEIWKGGTLAYSESKIGERTSFKVDSYGMKSVKLDMNVIKKEFSNAINMIFLYVKIYNKKTGKEILSTYYKPHLKLYQKLATSPASIGTTKAFVVVDASGGEKNKVKEIVFPLLVKPQNDKGNKWGESYYWAGAVASNQATYNSNRSGNRKHAARDLYTMPYTTVVAICDGEVLEIRDFYCLTHQITVKHKTNDGREFIIRYGELDPDSITIKVGNSVVQNQPLGKTGKLLEIDKMGNKNPLMTLNGSIVFMLHFEYYSGSEGLNLNNPLTDKTNPPFQRRNDMKDPLPILLEGYKESFQDNTKSNGRLSTESLVTSEKAIAFIIDWEKFNPIAYNDPKFCTIGYGHLIAKDLCKNITIPKEFKNGITKDVAVKLFKRDLVTFEKAVKREINVDLHQYEFDALVSLLYNTGEYFLSIGGDGGSNTMIKILINKKDYNGGAFEFLDVTNKNEPGLVIRRKAEFNMFTNNIYDSTH